VLPRSQSIASARVDVDVPGDKRPPTCRGISSSRKGQGAYAESRTGLHDADAEMRRVRRVASHAVLRRPEERLERVTSGRRLCRGHVRCAAHGASAPD
jgi:hypothetical protein